LKNSILSLPDKYFIGKSQNEKDLFAYMKKCKEKTDDNECCPTIKRHVKELYDNFKWKNANNNELKKIAKQIVQNKDDFDEIEGSCADEGNKYWKEQLINLIRLIIDLDNCPN
jgi:hypothetical protein